MSRVYTAESPIHGTGVFSSALFSPGEIIPKIDDLRVVTNAEQLDPAKGVLPADEEDLVLPASELQSLDEEFR